MTRRPPAPPEDRAADHGPDRAARRPLCARCQRPQSHCLCGWVRPTDNRVPLLLLQHPLEVAQAKGSARLLGLSLGQYRCEVGERFDPDALRAWLGSGALLLYPPENADAGPRGGAAGEARPLIARPPAPSLAEPAALPGTPSRLVVLDGTWRKTRKLLHLNPLLQQLPRCPLPALPPSLYAIRKAQRPEQRSTLEAACLALGALEGRPAHYAPLLQAFDGWVQSQVTRQA